MTKGRTQLHKGQLKGPEEEMETHKNMDEIVDG